MAGNILKAAESALNLEQGRLQKLKQSDDENQALKLRSIEVIGRGGAAQRLEKWELSDHCEQGEGDGRRNTAERREMGGMGKGGSAAMTDGERWLGKWPRNSKVGEDVHK
ncbi:hypothetical protein ACE6H2_002276 [Prunus campanulata]